MWSNDEKVVMIADAASASGEAIAYRAAVEGAKLVLNCKPADMERFSEGPYEKSGCCYMVTEADLGNGIETEVAVNKVIETYGKIDVLVYNKSVVYRSNIEDCTEEEFEKNLDENIKTAFIATQIVGNAMVSQKTGKVIYVGSIHDDKPTGCSFLFSIAQGALKNLSSEAALQLGEYGIDVNYIEMGPTGDEADVFLSDLTTFYKGYKYKIPSCKIGTFYDLANLVVFLASNECKYVNGAVIRMDGGLILHYIDQRANYKKLKDEGKFIE